MVAQQRWIFFGRLIFISLYKLCILSYMCLLHLHFCFTHILIQVIKPGDLYIHLIPFPFISYALFALQCSIYITYYTIIILLSSACTFLPLQKIFSTLGIFFWQLNFYLESNPAEQHISLSSSACSSSAASRSTK